MRNLRRLELEIRVLEKLFDYNNISYPSDGGWIKISKYELPQTRVIYNRSMITVQIKIPEHYDNVGVSEVFINRGLKVKRGFRWRKLPHTHDDQKEAVGKGYIWLCFEDLKSFIGLLDLINTLKLYFTDPFEYQEL